MLHGYQFLRFCVTIKIEYKVLPLKKDKMYAKILMVRTTHNHFKQKKYYNINISKIHLELLVNKVF